VYTIIIIITLQSRECLQSCSPSPPPELLPLAVYLARVALQLNTNTPSKMNAKVPMTIIIRKKANTCITPQGQEREKERQEKERERQEKEWVKEVAGRINKLVWYLVSGQGQVTELLSIN